jgi:glycosyltransferase involved in cell wall biosynthesis
MDVSLSLFPMVGNNMQIGVDACCWSNNRGFGRFTRELLKALVSIDDDNDYYFFVDKDTAVTSEFPGGANVVVAQTSVAPTQAASASGRRSISDLWGMCRQVMKRDLDLFFFPAVYSYFPVFNRLNIVLTIHDMIADHHPTKVFPSKMLMLFWKLKQNLAIRQANLIVTVSEYSKRQIIEYYNIPESHVRVITEGPSSTFRVIAKDDEMIRVCRHYQLDCGQRFILYVGGFSPHKNLHALVDVFHQLTIDPTYSDIKLVLVGDYEKDPFYSDYESLKSLTEQLGLTQKVIFTGFVEDSDLAYLYNAATLLVFPSLEEGFGLPAIEAMACGTPVISSNRASLPEILGDAGLFFDPYRPQTMLSVLKRVLNNDTLRNEMGDRGFMRSRQFTWETAARKTLSVFTELSKTR